jgi:hypothetical protein
MDTQLLFNLASSTIIAAIGWFAREIWTAVAELRRDMHQIEIDLPRSYMRRDEHQASMDRIEDMFRRIFDKLDGKQDK